jgi:signal transduction histidine kinase
MTASRHLRRLRDRRAVPVLGAVLLGPLSLLEATTDRAYYPGATPSVIGALTLVVGFLAMLRFPAVGAVVVAAYYPLLLLSGAQGPGGTGLIALLVALAYVGLAAPRRESLAALAVSVVVYWATDASLRGLTWDTIFFPVILAPAWWTGTLVRREQQRSREVLRLAAALDAQREASAHAAVVEERARIAREVHDSVAHSVSVMTLQIGGLRRQLDGVLADRPAEREVMLGLERLGRQSVEELRATVGMLREMGDDAPGSPVPSLARAEQLVTDVRAAGLEVDLVVDGDLAELPQGLDVAAYRVAQEALTNVLRHAPGASTVLRVERRQGTLVVTVRDDGARQQPDVSSTSGGHGLVGMRERTAMYGGTLEAGSSGSGYQVRAVFPIGKEWS